MEKLARYRAILAQIIEQEAQHRSAAPDVEVCRICDVSERTLIGQCMSRLY